MAYPAMVTRHNFWTKPYTCPMNMNQTLAVAALAFTVGISGLVAYGFRYVPISGDGISTPVTVWDRWTQEVCQVSLIADYPVHCSRSNPWHTK